MRKRIGKANIVPFFPQPPILILNKEKSRLSALVIFRRNDLKRGTGMETPVTPSLRPFSHLEAISKKGERDGKAVFPASYEKLDENSNTV